MAYKQIAHMASKIRTLLFVTAVMLSVVVLTTVILSFYGGTSGTFVYADDTSLGRTPDGVFPMLDDDVVMESEEVTIDLEKRCVECVFTFHNTGEDKTVLMGFPGKLDTSHLNSPEWADSEMENFKAYVDGTEMVVIREKTDDGNADKLDFDDTDLLSFTEWFTFNVRFGTDERVIVRNTYDFRPTMDSIGNVYTGYVLRTGALWKGPIGSAKVVFKLGSVKPYQIERLHPGGFRYEDNRLVWEREDFEPSYDLLLSYNDLHYSDEFINFLPDDEPMKENTLQKIDMYKMVVDHAEKGEMVKLHMLYNDAIASEDYLLALYINGFLSYKRPEPAPSLGDISVVCGQYYHDYLVSCEIEGPDNAFIELTISHNGNEKDVIDGQWNESSLYCSLIPEMTYTVTFQLRDWLDRTEQKSRWYFIPKDRNIHEIQPFSPSSHPILEPTDSTLEAEPTAQHGSIVLIVAGIILLVLISSLAVFLFVRKKRGREFNA